MLGKVCMITGSNAGIGKATALELARMKATVVLVCRSLERGEKAMMDIRRKSGNNSVTLMQADLSSQQEIRRLADAFKDRYQHLHVLVNNAGIIPPSRQVSVDGREMQFAVNHLAYFLLTNLLLERLKGGDSARIVNVSSMVHQWATIDFDDLDSEHAYTPTTIYARTKLANILFTYELARRLTGTGVTANCLHPGVIATRLNASYSGRSQSRDAPEGDAARGATTSVYLAASPEVAGISGQFFVDRRPQRSSALSYDETVARRLWKVSARLTGVSNET